MSMTPCSGPNCLCAKNILRAPSTPVEADRFHRCDDFEWSTTQESRDFAIAIRLIRLPFHLLSEIPETVADALKPKGQRSVVPTSIQGLSPNSPLLHALDRLPIQAVHHSIIGDRGRGDTPNSSDGVVPYWSSHLASARSEKIVPTGHDAMDNPQAVEEIRRILLLNLGIPENRQSVARAR